MKKLAILSLSLLMAGCATTKNMLGISNAPPVTEGYSCTEMQDPSQIERYCVNYPSIRPYKNDNNLKLAWVRVDYTNQNAYTNFGYITTFHQNIFNCKENTFAVVQNLNYNKKGDIVKSYTVSSMDQLNYNEPIPDTVGDLVLQEVCHSNNAMATQAMGAVVK